MKCVFQEIFVWQIITGSSNGPAIKQQAIRLTKIDQDARFYKVSLGRNDSTLYSNILWSHFCKEFTTDTQECAKKGEIRFLYVLFLLLLYWMHYTVILNLAHW